MSTCEVTRILRYAGTSVLTTTLKQLLTSKVNSPLSLSFAELTNQAQSCSSTASILLRKFFCGSRRKHWWVIRSTAVAMENNFVTILYHIRRGYRGWPKGSGSPHRRSLFPSAYRRVRRLQCTIEHGLAMMQK